jgi:Cu/Ag efflux protein CusF
MKTDLLTLSRTNLAITLCAAALLAGVITSLADDSTANDSAAKKQKPAAGKVYSGKIVFVNPAERVLIAESFWSTRTFSLAENCQVAFEDKPAATMADLRPGQKLEIRYENLHGVLIAHSIQQRNQLYRGRIQAMDPGNRTIEIKHGSASRTFTLPEDLAVELRDGASGKVEDLKTGQTVEVVYETPENRREARRIAQHYREFVGTIRSIDAATRTIKAKSFIQENTFRLAEGCKIMTPDNPDASLRDLRIGDRVEFAYENRDGVLVADRIGYESPSVKADRSETAKAESQVP